ncbi:MAG: hypothetical protein ACE5IO_06500 [Thermoplasmata archaeon]
MSRTEEEESNDDDLDFAAWPEEEQQAYLTIERWAGNDPLFFHEIAEAIEQSEIDLFEYLEQEFGIRFEKCILQRLKRGRLSGCGCQTCRPFTRVTPDKFTQQPVSLVSPISRRVHGIDPPLGSTECSKCGNLHRGTGYCPKCKEYMKQYMREYRQRKRETKAQREKLEHKMVQLYIAKMRLLEQKEGEQILQ